MISLPDRSLRLAFFGTPEIARDVLRAIINDGKHEVSIVVSQPDRPQGRGKKLVSTPVKALAEEHDIPVIQPTKLKDGAVAAQLRELKLDLAIVIAYGRILPTDVYQAPENASWNIHASLLPRHRGASPIQHAILSGDAETGVTVMQLSDGMDEGDMLHKESITLAPKETTQSLTLRLSELGGRAILKAIALAQLEGLQPEVQEERKATYAPLIKKQDGELDFTDSASTLERRIRAFQPWPGAFIRSKQGPVKILEATARDSSQQSSPGFIVDCTGKEIIIQTGDGHLAIQRLQPPGKKGMNCSDFLRGAGRHLQPGELIASQLDR